MKQLHIKFSDDEWKTLNDIYETRKKELSDIYLHKITLAGTIKDALLTSYMIHVDKNFTLIAKPKEEEKPNNDTLTDKKPKKEVFKSTNGAIIKLKPRATIKPAE